MIFWYSKIMLSRIGQILLILILFFYFSEDVWAGFIPIPQATPSTTPRMIVTTDDARWKKNTWMQQERLNNTPWAQYSMIKKWESIEVFEDRIHQIFIQKIALASGATIETFFDFDHYDPITGEPLYAKFSVNEKIHMLEQPPFSFINGQFFDPRKIYTPFSFGFKYHDIILTAWADNQREYKNIFSYSSGSGARIIPYNWEAFRDEKTDFAIVSLSMSEPHESNWIMWRTYICIVHPDAFGYSQDLFTFTFLAASEWYASDILHSWGCDDAHTSKLDSSGSSVFGIEGTVYHGFSRKWFPDYRKIPQIVGFYEN